MSMETMTQMIVIAEHMGSIDFTKSAMVKNVFRLGFTTEQAVMMHRMDVIGLDKRISVEEACRLAIFPGHSRIAMFAGDNKKIVEVALIRTTVNEVLEGRSDTPLSSVMVEPLYIMPHKQLGDLFIMSEIDQEIVGEIYEDSEEESREHILVIVDVANAPLERFSVVKIKANRAEETIYRLPQKGH